MSTGLNTQIYDTRFLSVAGKPHKKATFSPTPSPPTSTLYDRLS